MNDLFAMNENGVFIRRATVDDASFIGLMVCMALNYDEKHPLYEIFVKLAARDDAQYSYCNTLIAEADGARVGAVVGYDGSRLYELRAPLLALIKEKMGEVFDIEDETSAGEFYCDSLAVLPSHRGRGIGRSLLLSMREKAFADGFNRMGLLVDVDNPGAEALYSSLGFERVNPTTFLGHKMWHLQCVKND